MIDIYSVDKIFLKKTTSKHTAVWKGVVMPTGWVWVQSGIEGQKFSTQIIRSKEWVQKTLKKKLKKGYVVVYAERF